MNALFGNWQTSVIGFVAGIFAYFVQLGPNLPTTGKDWLAALMAASLAALGVFAKDSKTGSKAL